MIWRLFMCSDCEGEPFQVAYPVPDGAPYDLACDIETCPRCGSYLSLLGSGDVTITNRHSREVEAR